MHPDKPPWPLVQSRFYNIGSAGKSLASPPTGYTVQQHESVSFTSTCARAQCGGHAVGRAHSTSPACRLRNSGRGAWPVNTCGQARNQHVQACALPGAPRTRLQTRAPGWRLGQAHAAPGRPGHPAGQAAAVERANGRTQALGCCGGGRRMGGRARARARGRGRGRRAPQRRPQLHLHRHGGYTFQYLWEEGVGWLGKLMCMH